MAVRLKDYVGIEEGVANWLYGEWQKEAAPVMPDIIAAAEKGDIDTATRLINGIDVQSIAQRVKPGLRNHVIASLTFGTLLASSKSRSKYNEYPIPNVTEPVVNSYITALEDIRAKAVATLPAIMLEKAEISPSQGLCDHGPHSHTSTVLEVLKADILSAADKMNAVVMGQARSAIDVAANLNTSRLVSLGFLEQQMYQGITVYQITAVLDGRVCPVCMTMHGRTFSTAKAHDFTLALLQLTTPEEKKAFAPFPGQSKASVASLRGMTSDQIQSAGYHAPPYHPGCRCREVAVGTVPVSQTIPVGAPSDFTLADVPLPDPADVTALSSKVLSDTTEAAAQQLSQRLTDKELKALDDIFNNRTVNLWKKICAGPTLVQKGASDFSFCSAFNPKKMGQIVGDGDKAISKWELDGDLTLWRAAQGDFAKELIEAGKNLKGAVIHDKGFTMLSAKYVPDDATYVKVKLFAPKGTKAVKIGGEYAFPSSTKFQVFKTSTNAKGELTVYANVVEESVEIGAMPIAAPAISDPDVPEWWLKDTDYGAAKYKELHDGGMSHKAIWDDQQDYWANQDPLFDPQPYPGDDKIFPKLDLNATKAPRIAPAGTAAKEEWKTKLGADYLDIDDLTYYGPKEKGSIPGQNMVDSTGQKWLIKFVANEDVARNEVLAGKLYEAAGVEVPDLRLVRGTDNKIWVASKWKDGFEEVPEMLQGTTRIPGLYDNFTVDAWMSNWDIVGQDYDNVGLMNGRAFRVDIGGALRYRAQGGIKSDIDFPDEVIDIVKMRDPTVSPKVALVFKDITEAELRAGAAKVAAIPDSEIARLVKTYGPADAKINDVLANRMIARKWDIMSKYPKAMDVPPAVNLVEPVPNQGVRVTKDEWNAINDSRLNGYSMRTDFDQIESQDVLVHVELDEQGRKVVVATMKVRDTAADKVNGVLSSLVGSDTASAGQFVPKYHEINSAKTALDDKIKEWAVGFFKQLDTNQPLRQKDIDRFDQVRDLFTKFENKWAASDISMSQGLAARNHYKAYIDMADEAMRSAQVGSVAKWPDITKKMFSPFKIDTTDFIAVKAPSGNALSGFTAQRIDNLNYKQMELDRGWAKPVGREVSVTGERIVAERGNLTMEYVPSSNIRQRAFHHQLQIRVTGEGPDAVEQIFDVMDEMGLNSKRASPLDAQYLYLKELSYLDRDDWNKFAGSQFAAKPVQEQVDDMSAYFAKKFKTTPDSLADMALGDRQAYNQGIGVRYRPDTTGSDWDDIFQNYKLIHDNTGNMTPENLLDVILNSGGRVVTTTDKRRMGIPFDGMSPDSDISSGGASYAFTRLYSREQSLTGAYRARFVWNTKALKKTSTISYGGDLYGRVESQDYVWENRNTSATRLKAISKNSGNESIIKGGQSLFDDLEYYIVPDGSLDKALAVARKHGLDMWPDGRKLEDVIVAGRMAISIEKLKLVPDKVPSWASHNPDLYKTLAAQEIPEDAIKAALKTSQNEAIMATMDVPVWASKEPSHYVALHSKGVAEHIIAKKYMNLGLYYDDISPKKPATGSAIDLGDDEIPFASWESKPAAYSFQPGQATPVSSSAVPSYAYGYEKAYKQWAGKISDAEMLKYIKSKDMHSTQYPSWLKASFKDVYSSLKKDSKMPDALIIEEYPEMVK